MSTGDKVLYFILKHGWMVSGVAFLLVYASIFMELGEGNVVLQLKEQAHFGTAKKWMLGITGLFAGLLMWFRFRMSRN